MFYGIIQKAFGGSLSVVLWSGSCGVEFIQGLCRFSFQGVGLRVSV